MNIVVCWQLYRFEHPLERGMCLLEMSLVEDSAVEEPEPDTYAAALGAEICSGSPGLASRAGRKILMFVPFPTVESMAM